MARLAAERHRVAQEAARGPVPTTTLENAFYAQMSWFKSMEMHEDWVFNAEDEFDTDGTSRLEYSNINAIAERALVTAKRQH
jgi:hypothetical protein